MPRVFDEFRVVYDLLVSVMMVMCLPELWARLICFSLKMRLGNFVIEFRVLPTR